MKELESSRAHSFKERIEIIWDITQHYWYPLYDCKRSDVLAFDSDYIEGSAEKIIDVRKILLNLNYESIYEMHEYRTVSIIQTNKLVLTLNDNLERFWFSEDMSWIIYASHEGSITFGGEEILKQIKSKWNDWESNLFDTAYNLDEYE